MLRDEAWLCDRALQRPVEFSYDCKHAAETFTVAWRSAVIRRKGCSMTNNPGLKADNRTVAWKSDDLLRRHPCFTISQQINSISRQLILTCEAHREICRKSIYFWVEEENKMLIGKESDLFTLQPLVSSSLGASNIIHHPPADCESGIWFPFYISILIVSITWKLLSSPTHMEGLDFNQRIKYDFLFLQMGDDGRQSISIMLRLRSRSEAW